MLKRWHSNSTSMTARRCKGIFLFYCNTPTRHPNDGTIDAEALALEFDIDDGSTL